MDVAIGACVVSGVSVGGTLAAVAVGDGVAAVSLSRPQAPSSTISTVSSRSNGIVFRLISPPPVVPNPPWDS